MYSDVTTEQAIICYIIIGTSVVMLAQFYLQSMLSGQELASFCLGRNAGCYWTYEEEKSLIFKITQTTMQGASLVLLC